MGEQARVDWRLKWLGVDEGKVYMFGCQGREMLATDISILEMATAEPDIMAIINLA